MVFNAPGILYFINVNKQKSVISKCSGAKTENEGELVGPYLKNLMKSSQLADYHITYNTYPFPQLSEQSTKGLLPVQEDGSAPEWQEVWDAKIKCGSQEIYFCLS